MISSCYLATLNVSTLFLKIYNIFPFTNYNNIAFEITSKI